MKDKYKNKEWLESKLLSGTSMSAIGRMFNKDITTIRYWRDKFGIVVNKKVKYPKKEYTCPVCGKEFIKRVNKESQAVYCSQECAYKGRSLGYTKRNIRDSYNTSPTVISKTCLFCGENFEVDKTEKDRKFCSRGCFLKQHKINMSGKNNPSWNGGLSYNKRSYRGDNWDGQKLKCYERDNYTCQLCGVKCIGRKSLNSNNGSQLIQAHHIQEYKSEVSNILSNLITLCASCHKKST